MMITPPILLDEIMIVKIGWYFLSWVVQLAFQNETLIFTRPIMTDRTDLALSTQSVYT